MALHSSPPLQPIKTQLALLARDSSSVLSASSVSLLREAGLNDDEIRSLVFANREAIPDVGNKGSLSLEEAERVRLVAGMLFHCFDVFGSEKKALYWLHQPIARFHRQSPLQFLDASSNIEEVEEYLTQIEEGNFA